MEEINLKDQVYLKNCPEIKGTVVGMHREDFSKDIPVVVKNKIGKLIVIPYSELEKEK